MIDRALSFFSLVALLAVTGCSTELSVNPDVSIKKSYGSTGGRRGWQQGNNITIPKMLQNRYPTERLLSSVDLSPRFDFVISVKSSDYGPTVFKEALKESFGFSIEKENRPIRALVLTTSSSYPTKLSLPSFRIIQS